MNRAGVIAPIVPSGIALYVSLSALLLASALLGIAVGSTDVDWHVMLRILASKVIPSANTQDISQADGVIVWLIRVPRVLVAALVGMGLATAGAVMQALFRNALAEPGLTGAGSGAVVGAVICLATGASAHSLSSLPLSAMAGAFVSLLMVFAIAAHRGVAPVSSVLLAGIAANSLFGAFSSLLLSLSVANWQLAQEMLFWMLGGLDARTWTHVWLCLPFVLTGTAVALTHASDLDLLQQGEETAAAFGVNVESSKRLLMISAAVLTGASVAVSGLVGFVGLVVPHGMRMIFGPSNRRLLPASALAGASFLILCDLTARTIHPPIEVRLGIVTALIGGPAFIVLLLRKTRGLGI